MRTLSELAAKMDSTFTVAEIVEMISLELKQKFNLNFEFIIKTAAKTKWCFGPKNCELIFVKCLDVVEPEDCGESGSNKYLLLAVNDDVAYSRA